VPRWWVPPIRQVRRHAELQALLASPRTKPPDLKSVELLIGALQQVLDRESHAHEALDTKAGVLLAAILGIGFLSTDKLKVPGGPAVVPFALALFFSIAAVASSLIVLWCRALLVAPDPIPSAQATDWKELPFSQSIADSLAIAAKDNAGVNEMKGWWLNFSFLAATIAVMAFVVLGLMGGGTMAQEQGGALPSQSATSAATSPQTTPVTPTTTPDALSAPTSEPAFEHPQLGVMEIRKSWDPRSSSRAAAPTTAANDRG